MDHRSISIQKIEALMLNRVEGLEWYYFDLNLNQHGSELIESWKKEDIRSWLALIEGENGHFRYANSSNSGQEPPQPVMFTALLQAMQSAPELPRRALLRMFDRNDPVIRLGAAANEGLMGFFNRRSQKRRRKDFFRKIREGFRDEADNIVVLAEGDSWFEFPRTAGIDQVKDVIDWLGKKRDLSVYSLAAGGDWLSNMIHSGEYIELLPVVMPDALLLSAGGNDLLGGYRLASMLRSARQGQRQNFDAAPHLQRLLEKRCQPQPKDFDAGLYERGLSWLRDEFFQFLNHCFTQYFLFVAQVSQLERYAHLKFFTHGYDFAIPSDKRRGIFMRRILNYFLNSGNWLYDPLMMQGITDPKDQRAVVYTLICEFNEMMIQLATYQGFPHLYHIDCRGTAQSQDDWFDEIHLESKSYEKVADTFHRAIKATREEPSPQQKVFPVRADRSYSNQVSPEFIPA